MPMTLGLTEGTTLFSHVENELYCFIALTYVVVLLLIMTEDRTELNSHSQMAVFNGHLTWSCLLCLLGIKAADAKELKLIASQPSLKHVFNVANFDGIVDIQNEIILQVCSGVDEQLGELVSGEEGEILYINAFIGINLFLCMFKGLALLPLLCF